MKILQNDVTEQQSELKNEQRELTEFKKQNPDLVLDTADKTKSPAAMMIGKFNDAHMQTLNFKIALEQASNFTDDAMQLKRIVDETNAISLLPPDNEPIVDPGLLADISDTANKIHSIPPANQGNPFIYKPLHDKLEQDYLEKSRQVAAAGKRYIAYLNKQFDASQQKELELKKEVDAQSQCGNRIQLQGS